MRATARELCDPVAGVPKADAYIPGPFAAYGRCRCAPRPTLILRPLHGNVARTVTARTGVFGEGERDSLGHDPA